VEYGVVKAALTCANTRAKRPFWHVALWHNCKAAQFSYGACEDLKKENTPMAVEMFDSVDRRILAELQTDGRMTNVELATRVGLTAPPCLRRVRALEESGAIEGYHAALNGDALGYAITVFAMVSLKSQAEPDLKAFEAHVATLEPVRECHMLNGEIDFILKVVARSLQEFQSFLTTSLTTAPNVASVKTSLTIRTAKNLPGVPVTIEG
jgi:DNA-binding Lrp family transcriptional regulator